MKRKKIWVSNYCNTLLHPLRNVIYYTISIILYWVFFNRFTPWSHRFYWVYYLFIDKSFLSILQDSLLMYSKSNIADIMDSNYSNESCMFIYGDFKPFLFEFKSALLILKQSQFLVYNLRSSKVVQSKYFEDDNFFSNDMLTSSILSKRRRWSERELWYRTRSVFIVTNSNSGVPSVVTYVLNWRINQSVVYFSKITRDLLPLSLSNQGVQYCEISQYDQKVYTELVLINDRLRWFIQRGIAYNGYHSFRKYCYRFGGCFPDFDQNDTGLEFGLFSDLSTTHLNYFGALFYLIPAFISRDTLSAIGYRNSSNLFAWCRYLSVDVFRLSESNLEYTQFFDFSKHITIPYAISLIYKFLALSLIPRQWMRLIKPYAISRADALGIPLLHKNYKKKFFYNHELRLGLSRIMYTEWSEAIFIDPDWKFKGYMDVLGIALDAYSKKPVADSRLFVALLFYRFAGVLHDALNDTLIIDDISFGNIFSVTNNVRHGTFPTEVLQASIHKWFHIYDYSSIKIHFFFQYYMYLLSEFYIFASETYILKNLGKAMYQFSTFKARADVRRYYLSYLYSNMSYDDFVQNLKIHGYEWLPEFRDAAKEPITYHSVPEALYKKYEYDQRQSRVLSNRALTAGFEAQEFIDYLFAALLSSQHVPYSIWPSDRWLPHIDSAVSYNMIWRFYRRYRPVTAVDFWLQRAPHEIIVYLIIFSLNHLPDYWFKANELKLYDILKDTFNIKIQKLDSTRVLRILFGSYVYSISRLLYLDSSVETVDSLRGFAVLIGRLWLIIAKPENKMFIPNIISRDTYCWGYSQLPLYFFSAFSRYFFVLRYKSYFLQLFKLCHDASGEITPVESLFSKSSFSTYTLSRIEESYPGDNAVSGLNFFNKILYRRFMRYFITYIFSSGTANDKANIQTQLRVFYKTVIELVPPNLNAYFDYSRDFFSDENSTEKTFNEFSNTTAFQDEGLETNDDEYADIDNDAENVEESDWVNSDYEEGDDDRGAVEEDFVEDNDTEYGNDVGRFDDDDTNSNND